MTIYLAGPISGVAGYKWNFAAVAAMIRKEEPDASILNPGALPEGMHRADYMAICLQMVLRADIVVLLPGWRRSVGAGIEKTARGLSEDPYRGGQRRGAGEGHRGAEKMSHFCYETPEYISECSCDRNSCEGCPTYEAHKADACEEEGE